MLGERVEYIYKDFRENNKDFEEKERFWWKIKILEKIKNLEKKRLLRKNKDFGEKLRFWRKNKDLKKNKRLWKIKVGRGLEDARVDYKPTGC